MIRSRCLVVLLALFAACPPAGTPTDPGPASPAAPLATAPEPPGPYRITAEALDRYIRYQEKLLTLQAEALGAGTEPDPQKLRHLAERQGALRTEAGLTERDLQEIEQVVGEVISRRALAGTPEEESSLAELQALAARLSDGDRSRLEASIAAAREAQRATEALTEERQRFGDENVDAVLARERELARLWQRTISTFAAPPRPAAATP